MTLYKCIFIFLLHIKLHLNAWLVDTANADETKLSCLVRVGGVNKLLYLKIGNWVETRQNCLFGDENKP